MSHAWHRHEGELGIERWVGCQRGAERLVPTDCGCGRDPDILGLWEMTWTVRPGSLGAKGVGMRVIAVAAIVGLLIGGAFGPARAEPEAEKLATGAALAWLALIDDGRYAESWNEASGYFRGAVTEKGWDASLRGVRAPLGKVQSREIRAAKEARSLPGAPDGHYVVMEFAASFANKTSAIETVTFTLEKGGRWRAAGYFIR